MAVDDNQGEAQPLSVLGHCPESSRRTRPETRLAIGENRSMAHERGATLVFSAPLRDGGHTPQSNDNATPHFRPHVSPRRAPLVHQTRSEGRCAASSFP